MPESPSLYRKAALDQLSSPEQLDLLMRVTGPRAWLALIALGAVVLSAVVWSVVGTIPTQVSGQGILIRTGGVSQVVSTSAGRLTAVTVKVGDEVRQGDIVARVTQGDLSEQVQTARAELAAAHHQRQTLSGFQATDARQQAALFQSQRAEATQIIAEAGERARWFADRVKVEEELLKKGLWTESQLIATRQEGRAQVARQENARTRLNEITVAELAWKNRANQEQATLQLRIAELERVLAGLERKLASASAVVSSYNGRVVEVTIDDGQIVSAGSPVLTVEPFGGTLEALLYLQAGDGKKVAPGMAVRLAPATVKPEEFGYIMGTVRSVSPFPATTPGMMRVLHNERLVSALSAAGAPFELYATLTIDRATPSGYHWTSGAGPDVGLFSGTLANGLVTVRTQRPIELVIPYVRSWLGL
jgi:HlyD family secretion protein